jgi:2-dehydro-3-deoxyphosphogluconate aldolase / (4S)-4-hydroxy-2-oxoglutarate aldolase
MAAPRDRQAVVRAIEETGVVAVVRLADASQVHDVSAALVAGGVSAIEITMTVPGAVGIIAALAASAGPDVIVGAGTVLDVASAKAVIDAGAAFVVSPVFRPGVVAACHDAGRAVMPGCFTPTEILSAWEAGADVVKVFPATSLGPSFFKDVLAPLPALRLMPTGGVTLENAGAWIRAGAIAIGVGTALVDRGAVRARRFDEITANARHFVAAVAAARTGQTSAEVTP